MATLETQYKNWLKENELIEYSEWLNRFSEIHNFDKIEKAQELEQTQFINESWEDIEDDYLKENYPVFGGPFTDALTPFEWLKTYFNSPKRK